MRWLTLASGGLRHKISLHKHSDHSTFDHIVLRLDTAPGPGGPTYLAHITSATGERLPNFEGPRDYASWGAKVYKDDEDKDFSERCWEDLKHTRVLDIVGGVVPGGTVTQTGIDVSAEPTAPIRDNVAETILEERLSPGKANWHKNLPVDASDDPVTAQLRWFADALQNLEVVRYIGMPAGEALVRLFSDVGEKVLFAVGAELPPTAARVPGMPEISPGASSKIVSNLRYSPEKGPSGVPIQYDFPTTQEMEVVYIFPPLDVTVPTAQVSTHAQSAWTRLVSEIAGILTFFEDYCPELVLVDFPFPGGEGSAITGSNAAVDEGQVTSPFAPNALTKDWFLAALSAQLVDNVNDPDHLNEMIGTKGEGEVGDVMRHLRFMSRREYQEACGSPEVYNIETAFQQ